MDTKHTPGPLEVRVYETTPAFRSIARHYAVTRPDGHLIALTGPVGAFQGFADDGQSLADAQLFAAAPELRRELAHLVRLLEPLERGGGLDVPGLATLNGARAALAKACGGPRPPAVEEIEATLAAVHASGC